MKKSLLIVTGLLFGIINFGKAQCNGQVTLDVSAIGDSSGNINITTTNPNEIIMISYDGWNGPGTGPVKVDGNPATHINTANTGNSGTAETYAYAASAAGLHHIVCTETNYNAPYYINTAAAFYTTNCSSPFNIASLTSKIDTIPCLTGGSISGTITTTVPGSMIYTNCEINTGTSSFPISWTGAVFLHDGHGGNGIEASSGYNPTPLTGTYTITATNSSPSNNGCGGLTMVLVVIPPSCVGSSITLTTSKVNPTCNNSNGAASVTATGGTAPYTYSWNPSAQTTPTATGLSAGTYTVTVTDHAGCTATAAVTLASGAITVNAYISNHISCNGGTGGVSETITGGTAPFTYSWSPGGGTSATENGLSSATYTVTVTDNNGCTATASVNLTQPAVLNVTTTINNACGGGQGKATAHPTGGTGPYTYTWSPTGGNSAIASNLTAGTYTLNVTDANGCTGSATATIISAPAETINVTGTTDNHCFGGYNGSITTSTTGGTAPYNYAWSPVGGINPNAINLAAGCYTVTVTDSNGCTATASACITQPAQLHDSMTAVTNLVCRGNNTGSLTVGVSGGTGAYTYLWNTGGTGNSITGLSAACYTVTVNDANGCTASVSYCLSQPAQLAAGISANPTSICTGDCSIISLTPTGGTPSYSYAWSDGNTANAHIVCPAITTTYTGQVKDSCGAVVIDTIKIIVDTIPTLSFHIAQDTACSANTIDVLTGTPSGGTYSGPGVSGNNFNPHAVGSGGYWLYYTYSDSNSCSARDSLHVTVDLCLGVNNISSLDKQIILFPNPFSQSLTVDIKMDGPVYLEVYDMLGQKIDEVVLDKGTHVLNTETYPNGVYFLQIKTPSGIVNKKLVKAE